VRATSSSTTRPRKPAKPLTTHQFFDGTQHPWEFKRVWHLEPSLSEPGTVYAGVEDAALVPHEGRRQVVHELAGLRGHGTGPKWQPGAGGMGLHTIILDPSNPARLFIAISAAGAFRSDDAGTTWKPINRGLKSEYLPEPTPEVGFCVHHMVMHPARPGVLFMQLHQGAASCAATTPATCGRRSAGTCPPISLPDRSPCARAGDALRRPDGPESPGSAGGKLRVYRSRTGGDAWEPLTKGPASGELLRERAARRDGRRFARFVRHLFRHYRRSGLLLTRFRRHLGPDRSRPSRPSCPSSSGR